MNGTAPKSPRNLWPLGIVAFLVCFGTFIFGFTAFALRLPVDLVTKDYYADDLTYQKQIDREGRAKGLGSQVAIRLADGNRAISVRLPAGHEQAAGVIKLYRPSDAAADVQLKLAPDALGTQVLDAGRLKSGLWKVRVTWQTGGEEFYSEQALVLP